MNGLDPQPPDRESSDYGKYIEQTLVRPTVEERLQENANESDERLEELYGESVS